MSILSRASEARLPLTEACAQAGYTPDVKGQRTLRQALRRKGFGDDIERIGNHWSIQVSAWVAFTRRCDQDDRAHREQAREKARARWAARRAEAP